MTNREINEAIARLKNWTFSVGTETGSQVCHDGKYYNWSENIADAWELFEEMPKGTFLKKIRHGESEFRCSSSTANDDGPINFIEKKASLAICFAWIAWKENKETF